MTIKGSLNSKPNSVSTYKGINFTMARCENKIDFLSMKNDHLEIVVTNYPTASSQIKNGDDGVIVPLDNEGCAKGLAKFILDTEKQEHIIEYLKVHDYGNVEEVEKIYDIISERE